MSQRPKARGEISPEVKFKLDVSGLVPMGHPYGIIKTWKKFGDQLIFFVKIILSRILEKYVEKKHIADFMLIEYLNLKLLKDIFMLRFIIILLEK